MENKLAESILKVCGVFNKNFVEYIIVGGTAVALHGYFRRSMNMAGAIADKPDLDFWYRAVSGLVVHATSTAKLLLRLA